MFSFTSVAVFSALVLSISALPTALPFHEGDGFPVVYGYKDGEKCPGEFFYDDCNKCYCLDDGFSADCTMRNCETGEFDPSKRPNLPHLDFFSKTEECTPGKYFYDKCNTCHCSPSGKTASCTDMNCLMPENPRIDGYRNGQKCPAGQKFYDGCNSCVCGNDGVSAACTLKLCQTRQRRSVAVPNFPHIDNFHEVGECTPGQNFIDICNTCRCGADGKSAGCTLIACPPTDKPRIDNYVSGKKCPAGKTFYDKCNTCNCSNDGRSAGCTLMACPDYE